MERFGEILHALRTQRGLTQKDLAESLGVSLSAISMYERGHRQPDLGTLSRLATLFGVSVDCFFDKDTPTPPSSGETGENQTVQAIRNFAEERNLPYEDVLRWFLQGDSPTEVTLHDSTGRPSRSPATKTAPTRHFLHLNSHELAVILAYRQRPEVQPFVDKLLDVKKG